MRCKLFECTYLQILNRNIRVIIVKVCVFCYTQSQSTKYQIHVYQVNDTKYITGDWEEEETVTAKHWILPNTEFEGRSLYRVVCLLAFHNHIFITLLVVNFQKKSYLITLWNLFRKLMRESNRHRNCFAAIFFRYFFYI